MVLSTLDTAFYEALNRDSMDDLVVGATLAHPTLPLERLALGFPTFTWDGDEWRSIDGNFGTLRSILDTEPDGSSVTFDNLSKEWTERLNRDKQQLNGVLFTIFLMFLNTQPGAGQDAAKFRIQEGPWTISGSTLNDTAVQFEFTTAFDALKFQVSALLARSRLCQFAYKDKFCKSTSPLATCGKTLNDCAERHAVLRFSSWPFSDARVL